MKKCNYHALCFLSYFRICFHMKFLFELLRGTCCAPSDLFCVTKELLQEYILMGSWKWRFAIANQKLRREWSEKQTKKKKICFHLPLQPFSHAPTRVTSASFYRFKCSFHSVIIIITTGLCNTVSSKLEEENKRLRSWLHRWMHVHSRLHIQSFQATCWEINSLESD